MSNLATLDHSDEDEFRYANNDYLVFMLGEQAFCVQVLQIRDVIKLNQITKVPLSVPEIAGVLNLRGHIVTAVDGRVILGLEPSKEALLQVVIEQGEHLYSMIVDSVRDVITVEEGNFDSNPAILKGKLSEISRGVVKRDNELIVLLDTGKLFASITQNKDTE